MLFSGRELEKHTDTPYVSGRMTVIRVKNVYTWVKSKQTSHSDDKRTVHTDGKSDSKPNSCSYLGHVDSHVKCLVILTLYFLFDT